MLVKQRTRSHVQQVIAEGIKCIKEEHLHHTTSENRSSSTALNYQFPAGKFHNHWVLAREDLSNGATPNVWKEDGASSLL